MRNYSPKFFFIKRINIINPFGVLNALNKPVREIENKIDISFFPEGGSLVDNVSSAVAFKAVNALGKGCDVTVELYTSSGELITIFKSTHKGMGFFNLKPVPGQSYYTIIKGQDGTQIKAPLPRSFPAGIAIRTLITPDKNLILSVNTNEATLPSFTGKDLQVNISLRNLINRTTVIRVDSLVNNYLIPLNDFPDGILRVTLSVPDGLPLCERLVFLQKNESVRLNITTEKYEYRPRGKVTAEITISGDSTFSCAGDFSLSAAEERFTDYSSPYPQSIASWFLLESDVNGTVEEPSYYFDQENRNRLQDLDLLLLTQGWRDFKWKYDSSYVFSHEIGFNISGNVRRLVRNNPIEGIKINLGLFYLNNVEFLDTKTDKNGKFRFEELDIYGKARAFVSSTGRFENMQGRISTDTIKYDPPKIEFIMDDTIEFALKAKSFPIYRKEAMFKLNALKKYKLSDTISLGEVNIAAEKVKTIDEVKLRESRKFYSTPDKELIIPPASENFAGDVFSYLTGRISGVRIVRGLDPCSIYFPDDVQVYIHGQYITEMRCAGPVKIGALILLDGFEIDESGRAFILTLPMNIIDRVDILNASPLYGVRGANGVINIITRSGVRREPVKLSPNSVYTSVQGFDVPRIFYSPKYDNTTQLTNVPDYRSTLYWQPVIKVERNKQVTLDFNNSDNTGTINITVEGVTEEGIPLTGKIKYEVK
jgi:hypothetical protein